MITQALEMQTWLHDFVGHTYNTISIFPWDVEHKWHFYANKEPYTWSWDPSTDEIVLDNEERIYRTKDNFYSLLEEQNRLDYDGFAFLNGDVPWDLMRHDKGLSRIALDVSGQFVAFYDDNQKMLLAYPKNKAQTHWKVSEYAISDLGNPWKFLKSYVSEDVEQVLQQGVVT